MRTKPVEPVKLPCCGYFIDAISYGGKDDIVPKPGNYSLCVKCGALLQYDENMNNVVVPDNEFLQLPENIRLKIAEAQLVIKEFNEEE